MAKLSATSSARPLNPEDAADWEASVNLAKQFIASKEGGLYAKALGEKDPKKRIAILDQLIKLKLRFRLIIGVHMRLCNPFYSP